jgi:site-specific recombinase XerD
MIEHYLLLLRKDKAPNSCGLLLTGLRFFYIHVAEEKLRVNYRMRKKNQKLPTILTQEQVAKNHPLYNVGACVSGYPPFQLKGVTP